jgi:hypothetical protein
MKTKSKKRMTESNAKELEKQELRNTDAQITAPPADQPPIDPPAPPSEPVQDPADAELDRIVAEQQALMDKRMQEEADKKAEEDIARHEAEERTAAEESKEFTFTALINFKKYVKVEADTEEEAVRMIEDMKLGEFISKKDMRFDKRENN